jgi:hypothetical protein
VRRILKYYILIIKNINIHERPLDGFQRVAYNGRTRQESTYDSQSINVCSPQKEKGNVLKQPEYVFTPVPANTTPPLILQPNKTINTTLLQESILVGKRNYELRLS